jgi:hypothetical protein
MKTELRLSSRTVEPAQIIIEMWYDGKLIGEIIGADSLGVLISSKHPMIATCTPGIPEIVKVAIVPVPI